MTASPCYHCNEPVPTDVTLKAHIGERQEAVCCIGCQAAVEWINGLGLNDYYRLRTTPAERVSSRNDYTVWDRTEMQRLFVRYRPDGKTETCVLVEGLRCSACTWLIERALGGISGVNEVSVNPTAKRLRLVWTPQKTSLSELLVALSHLGYTPYPLNAASLDDVAQREQRLALKRLVIAGIGMMQAMMYAVALYTGSFDGMDSTTRDFFRWLGFFVTTPVVLYSAQPFFVGALRELRFRHLGMDTPVALAVALVYVASLHEAVRSGSQVYFDSASMFVFFLLAGRYLEMRARHRSNDVVDALARLQPALAQRHTADNVLETVGVHELLVGDVVVVSAGGIIPADGILLTSICHADESLLSGEATPRLHHRGDTLIAGSALTDGPIELQVTHIGANTILSSVLRLVTRAQAERPRLARQGETLAGRFVAIVLLLTLATWISWMSVDPLRAFPAALAVLVVSCPCAFALAVPAALTRALALLAKQGILVLKSDALETLVQANHIVFDKTGTLSENHLEIETIEPTGILTREQCLLLAAQLETGNNHPIAQAIRNATPTSSSSMPNNLRVVDGCGVEAEIDGDLIRFGRTEFATALCDFLPTQPDEDALVLANRKGILARFILREHMRHDAPAAIEHLRQESIDLHIFSGDSASRVAALAHRIDITDFRSRMSPSDKLAELKKLRAQGAVVVMVGDGVNDAPILAGADVSIALGSGAELAQASADIVLANNRLSTLIDACSLARQTLAILRQNLHWAMIYNVGSIPLAALGWIPPWLAAIGMSLSSLFVVLNSFRIGNTLASNRNDVVKTPTQPLIASPTTQS